MLITDSKVEYIRNNLDIPTDQLIRDTNLTEFVVEVVKQDHNLRPELTDRQKKKKKLRKHIQDSDEHYSLQQAADIMGVTERSVFQMIARYDIDNKKWMSGVYSIPQSAFWAKIEREGMTKAMVKRSDELLLTSTVADRLGLSQATVSVYCGDGTLECEKHRRKWAVRRDSYEQFKSRKKSKNR